ncbi:MAG: hypothetical protein M3Q40_06890 [Pseudomonadota bacterium]|nr:hypothetical protein [Pseudomonadota bacterium]
MAAKVARSLETELDVAVGSARADGIGAEIAAAAAVAAAIRAASGAADTRSEGSARSAQGPARRHRQTVVMPYFSFAPRG